MNKNRKLIIIMAIILIINTFFAVAFVKDSNQVTSTIKITYSEKKNYKIIETVNEPISVTYYKQLYPDF